MKHYDLIVIGSGSAMNFVDSIIQENRKESAHPMLRSIHIHPSLSEVVQRAEGSLTSPEEYHHIPEHQNKFEAS